jgi:uncharacterized protein YajQ (UPF0234 family)
MKNEELLRRVKEERNILETIKRRKANCIGNTLRRSCHLQHGIEGKLQGMILKIREDEEEDVSSHYRRQDKVARRRGRRRKQLLYR